MSHYSPSSSSALLPRLRVLLLLTVPWPWSCLLLLLLFVLLLLLWPWSWSCLSCSIVVASSFFFSFEVSYPSSSSFFLLWWCPLWMFVCGCYCLFSLLIAFFLVFTMFVFFFIGIFFVCMWLFCKNEPYGLPIRMNIFFIKKNQFFNLYILILIENIYMRIILKIV